MSQEEHATEFDGLEENLKAWLKENDLEGIASQLTSSLTLQDLSKITPEEAEKWLQRMTLSTATRRKLKNALQKLTEKTDNINLSHEFHSIDSAICQNDAKLEHNNTKPSKKNESKTEPPEDDIFSDNRSETLGFHKPVLDPKLCCLATMTKVPTGKRKSAMPVVYHKKVVMAGAQSVGKSCIAIRLVKNTFDENMQATLGSSFLTYTLHINGCTFELDIWDTAGQERYSNLAPLYYRDSHAGIVVYDVTDQYTLERAKLEVSRVRQNTNTQHILIALVGNKCDLKEQREVNYADVYQYAEEENLLFLEVSARTGENIHQLFELMARYMPLQTSDNTNNPSKGSVDLGVETNSTNNGNCC